MVSALPTFAVNQNILEMEYAVRGPIPMRAAQLENQGKKIIPCHIGNPQALGQSPISYVRQVLGLVEDPSKIGRERSLKTMFEETPFSELKELDFVPDDILNLRLSSCRCASDEFLLTRVMISDRMRAGTSTIPTNPMTNVTILSIPPRFE